MRLADAHGSLLRLRQERSRKLFMGSGCACHHARLRGDDDAVVTMMLYVQKVLNNAECWRRKTNELHDKNSCFSMIYE